MNGTIIPNEKLKRLKLLIASIEVNKKVIKEYNNSTFISQGFKLYEQQTEDKNRRKKEIKKIQKEINETIKNL